MEPTKEQLIELLKMHKCNYFDVDMAINRYTKQIEEMRNQNSELFDMIIKISNEIKKRTQLEQDRNNEVKTTTTTEKTVFTFPVSKKDQNNESSDSNG